MTGPAVTVTALDDIYHVVRTPCGASWNGMTATDDLAIQVRRLLLHVRSCARCQPLQAPPKSVCPDCGEGFDSVRDCLEHAAERHGYDGPISEPFPEWEGE